jgi:hypothetical protein
MRDAAANPFSDAFDFTQVDPYAIERTTKAVLAKRR